MKRFKDCKLTCVHGQTSYDLLQLIKSECEMAGLRVENGSAVANSQTLCAYVEFDGYPSSRVILNTYEKGDGVDVVNIVPLKESGVSQLEIPAYNGILDSFRDMIFSRIEKKHGNAIIENTEDYTIKEIIPKSFCKLETWLSFYPLSHHPNDEHRWFDFLIALIDNGERVGASTLSEYIKENHHWSDKDLFDLELRFESQMELLEYYARRR